MIARIAAEAGLLPGEARRVIAARVDEARRQALADGRRRDPRPEPWTSDSVIAAIRAFHAEKGRLPRRVDFDGSSTLPSRRTVVRKFGTLAEAFEAAGLRPIEQERLFEEVA